MLTCGLSKPWPQVFYCSSSQALWSLTGPSRFELLSYFCSHLSISVLSWPPLISPWGLEELLASQGFLLVSFAHLLSIWILSLIFIPKVIITFDPVIYSCHSYLFSSVVYHCQLNSGPVLSCWKSPRVLPPLLCFLPVSAWLLCWFISLTKVESPLLCYFPN